MPVKRPVLSILKTVHDYTGISIPDPNPKLVFPLC
jgi:hypothetical protein